jgi:hypothetical protein
VSDTTRSNFEYDSQERPQTFAPLVSPRNSALSLLPVSALANSSFRNVMTLLNGELSVSLSSGRLTGLFATASKPF